jgi:phosphoribosylformylglycinamidine synthase
MLAYFPGIFERTQKQSYRWGQAFCRLLGAFKAQLELGCGAIGGKDSMSGTFENIDVPATLVSFAVSTASSGKIISNEFKKAGNKVILITPEYDENNLPRFDSIKSCFERVEALIADGTALSVWTVGFGGVAEAVAKMSLGNRIGFKFAKKLSEDQLFYSKYGSFVIELDGDPFTVENVIGETISEYVIDCKDYTVNMHNIQKIWEERLEPVFPCNIKTENTAAKIFTYTSSGALQHALAFTKPRVLIPVFPGTNCEYDSARAFERAGAVPETVI